VTTSRQPSRSVDADDDTQAVMARPAAGVPEQATPQGPAGADDAGPDTSPHGISPVAPPASRTTASSSVGTSSTDLASAPTDLAAVVPPRPITSAARRTGKVRKARLRLLRVEPWSVMKSAFVLSIAIGITFVVAVATLWSVVDAAGVFEQVGGLVTDLTQSQTSAGIVITDYVGFTRVVGLATVIAVVDVVLLTALATLFAFLYNLAASLLGGFEITLAEDD
jgi:hypothetical protein